VFATIYYALCFMSLWSHQKAMCTDPGTLEPDIYPRPLDEHLAQPATPILIDREEVTVCLKCSSYRPQRAHHCSVCGRCVRDMDHHWCADDAANVRVYSRAASVQPMGQQLRGRRQPQVLLALHGLYMRAGILVAHFHRISLLWMRARKLEQVRHRVCSR
jgi:hypothetical protein